MLDKPISSRYAVNLDDGGWQRAKILEIEEDSATVFLGDHGDDDVVYINKIKILEPQFRKLPAQVIISITNKIITTTVFLSMPYTSGLCHLFSS